MRSLKRKGFSINLTGFEAPVGTYRVKVVLWMFYYRFSDIAQVSRGSCHGHRNSRI